MCGTLVADDKERPAMKPALILQHLNADGPAYLGRWLSEQGEPFEVRNSEAGDVYPDDLRPYSALAILGGEMSANDPLPSLRQAERLILLAIDRGLPVIGHCLGGQLMARALGARVVDAPTPEIGWQPMQVQATPEALSWLGDAGPRSVFQWHYETFELPRGAVRLAESAACANQAFAIGAHLAMQFHVEVDEEKLGRWSLDDGSRFVGALQRHPSVQSGEAMRAGIAEHLEQHQALARRLYRRWLDGRVS